LYIAINGRDQRGNSQTRAGLRADAWFGSVKAAVALGNKFIRMFHKSRLDRGFLPRVSLKRLS
jgi:hypothetical protein